MSEGDACHCLTAISCCGPAKAVTPQYAARKRHLLPIMRRLSWLFGNVTDREGGAEKAIDSKLRRRKCIRPTVFQGRDGGVAPTAETC
jgi:hypothetical protein